MSAVTRSGVLFRQGGLSGRWYLITRWREHDNGTIEALSKADVTDQLPDRLARALEARAVDRPEVVVLCGSTRFMDAFIDEQRRLTLDGRIVLSVGLFGHVEGLDLGTTDEPSPVKVMLDELHKRKIDLADRVHVVNVGGYVGCSTASEIEYAAQHGKPVSYMEAAP